MKKSTGRQVDKDNDRNRIECLTKSPEQDVWSYGGKALPDNYKMFIEKMDEPLERVVCDYIAGMSDQYSVAKFEEIFVPASWKV